MRLSQVQRTAIVESVQESFGTEAKVWLFGSRVDDHKLGGDIDLLVEAKANLAQATRQKLRALGLIQRRIGEQKIDLVVTDGSPECETLLITRNARAQGVLLE
jgi:predicted nucleotidyltransferase